MMPRYATLRARYARYALRYDYAIDYALPLLMLIERCHMLPC